MPKKNYDIFIKGIKTNYSNTRYSYFANFIHDNKTDFNKKQYKINLSTSEDYAIYYKTDSNIKITTAIKEVENVIKYQPPFF